MSTRSQASYNPTLTNYAYGVAQDQAASIADWVAPVVVVPSTTGKFKSFSDKNAFQEFDTARGVGSGAKRIQFASSDTDYNAEPHALEIAVDDSERDAAGDGGMQLDQSKVKTLVIDSIVSRERRVEAVMDDLAATGGTGVWSTPATNNPISEIDARIQEITIATGMMPNAILFGIAAWNYFRNHDNVTGRAKSGLAVFQTGDAGSLFLNPQIECRVGTLSYDTTKHGKTASKANIVGSEVYIFIRSPNPTVYDPSWMKTFQGGRGGVDQVRTYRDESARSDIHALDWSEDIQITGSICAKRITVT